MSAPGDPFVFPLPCVLGMFTATGTLKFHSILEDEFVLKKQASETL